MSAALPRLSRAQTSVIVCYILVFVTAFVVQVVAGVSGLASISTLFAGVSSAVAAGLVTLFRSVKRIGELDVALVATEIGLSPKVERAGYQLLTTFLAFFVGTVGCSLALNAYGAGPLPKLADVIVAAIASGVYSLVDYLTSLIPAPKT